jgi:hypothetical protein
VSIGAKKYFSRARWNGLKNIKAEFYCADGAKNGDQQVKDCQLIIPPFKRERAKMSGDAPGNCEDGNDRAKHDFGPEIM